MYLIWPLVVSMHSQVKEVGHKGWYIVHGKESNELLDKSRILGSSKGLYYRLLSRHLAKFTCIKNKIVEILNVHIEKSRQQLLL